MLRLLALIPLLVATAGATEPSTVTGNARVIDGDTFAIGETMIRLFDIERARAPKATLLGRSLPKCPVWAVFRSR